MLVDMDIKKLKNFSEYPFNLSMDEKMKQLLESIVINGIITPLIVRKKDECYEIILDVSSESWNLNCAKFIDEINNENNMIINNDIKLTNLIPELLELVDNKRIAFRPAIELSYLSKENQVIIRNIFDMDEVTPSLSQAIQLKRLEQEGRLNEEIIEEILSKEKPNQKERFSISYEELKKYLQKNYSDKQIKNIIVEALKKYYPK